MHYALNQRNAVLSSGCPRTARTIPGNLHHRGDRRPAGSSYHATPYERRRP